MYQITTHYCWEYLPTNHPYIPGCELGANLRTMARAQVSNPGWLTLTWSPGMVQFGISSTDPLLGPVFEPRPSAIGGQSNSVSTVNILEGKAQAEVQPCSFSAETKVLTERGFKPISQIRKGEKVWAYDEKSKTMGFFPVEQVWKHDDPIIEYLTIDGETITTTPEHPFFTQERGWVAAGELWRGAHIRKADGSYGAVDSFSFLLRSQAMYNLTVTDAHTFFVGQHEWLVHNDCGGLRFAQQGISRTFRSGKFAGMTIDEVAAGWRIGIYSPDDLPINIVVRDRVAYTVNNRSLMKLYRAGFEPTIFQDVTGDPFFERQLTQRFAELGGDPGPNFLPRIR